MILLTHGIAVVLFDLHIGLLLFDILHDRAEVAWNAVVRDLDTDGWTISDDPWATDGAALEVYLLSR